MAVSQRASKKRSLNANRSSAVSALVMAGPYTLNSTNAPWSVTTHRPSASNAFSSAPENLCCTAASFSESTQQHCRANERRTQVSS